MMSRASRICFAAACVLLSSKQAFADPQKCVEQNNQGADARAAHHLLAARQAYRACIAEPDCPDVVVSECSGSLDDLKAAVPTIIVSIVDGEGHDLESPSLLIDGQSVTLDGSTLELDPGPHDFVASSGGLTSRILVDAKEHELNRRVEIVLKPAAPAPSTPTWALPPVPTESAPRKASDVPSYVLAGVGVLGAAGFGYLALSGHSDLNALYDCKPRCSVADVQRVHTKYHLADVSLGISLVSFAAAGYLFWANHRESASTRTGSISFDVTASPNVIGLSAAFAE